MGELRWLVSKTQGNSLGNCRHSDSISHVVDKLGDLLFHMGTFSSKLSRRNIVTVKPKESDDGRANRDLTESQTRVIKTAVQEVSREVQRASVNTEGGKWWEFHCCFQHCPCWGKVWHGHWWFCLLTFRAGKMMSDIWLRLNVSAVINSHIITRDWLF